MFSEIFDFENSELDENQLDNHQHSGVKVLKDFGPFIKGERLCTLDINYLKGTLTEYIVDSLNKVSLKINRTCKFVPTALLG